MAFKTTPLNHNISDDGRREIMVKEFKRWLMRFSTDKDDLINKSELQQILKTTGGWFSSKLLRPLEVAADC
ncbi:putative EF-hand domain-containing protein [Helianthus anomalus]